MYILSQRSNIAPFVVMDVMQAAAERVLAGKDVLHLEVGQPSTPAPSRVLAAAEVALRNNKLGYTVALGNPELRAAIAAHYKYYYQVNVNPANIVVTSGSSGAFVLAFLSSFDNGARVAVPSPGYPCYRNILRALDLQPIDIPVTATTNYLITPNDLEKLPGQIDGLIISSPSNPTGTMYTSDGLHELVEYCHKRRIQLISDEIYHGITFDCKATTALNYSQDAIIVNSFSKYFSMTGWRVGWMVVPERSIRRIERLIQNLYIATSTLSQIAAIEAFHCYEELDMYVDQYRHKRDLLYNVLQNAGINDLASPDGAFYIYANIDHLTNDSVRFCQRILNETGVAVTPGVDFDPYLGNKTMRFSYAADLETIEHASERLYNWFKGLG
jgi:aspartate/methionine/tyrosine aminotransferase